MHRPSSPLWLAAALTALAFAAPPAAMATNYCVGDAACVSGGGIDKGTGAAGLTAALAAAAAHANAGGPDRVIVGAGTYSRTAGNAVAFRADTGDALTLQGAGPSATVLSRETFNNGTVLAAGPATTVADLGIVIPGGTGMLGLGLGGSAENVAVTVASGGATSASGVALQAGATFGHGTLTVPGGTGAAMTAGGTLTDSTLSGLYGVQASGVATVRRARFVHATTGISAYGATLTVEDTLFDLGGVASTALYAEANVNGNAVTTLRHLTIVHGVSNAVGVELQSYDGMSSTGTLRDSVINGVGRPFELGAGDPGSATSLATSFSSFPDDELLRWGTNGAAVPAPPANTNRLSGTPGFVDGAAGDWRLRFDSALVDAGTPGALGAAESATDAAGLPRRVAGRRDAGAFEYQRRAPVVTAAADATTAAIGAVVAFTGSGTDPDPGEVVAGYQWTFDDGATVPAGATATHAFTAAGVHTATLTAVDPAGVAGVATVSVTVPEAGVAAPAPGGAPGPATLKTPSTPVLSALAFSRRTFLPGTGSRGSRLTYRLSAPAVVTFAIERAAAGRLRGTTCSGRPGHGRRCTRYVAMAGRFTQAGRKGTNTLRFAGRVGGHALAPGRYRLVARVPKGPAVRASFRIAAAKR